MTGFFERMGSFTRSNKLFVVFLSAGAVLRVLVSLAYAPALMLQRDAYAYVNQAQGNGPSGGFRPAIYPLFLKPLLLWHNVTVVAAVQHLIGLGLAIGLYVLLRRNGVGATAAALGTAPLLLDPYQIDLEQYLLTETLFELLTCAAIGLLLWRPPPSIRAVLICGLLLLAAGLTRYTGLILILPAVAFLLVSRAGLVKVTVLMAAFAIPLVAYSALGSTISSEGPAGRAGFFMFGRVLPFADCPDFDTVQRLHRLFCRKGALPLARNEGFFTAKDQLGTLIHKPDAERTLLRFSLGVIAHQPVDYALAVGADFGRYFDTTDPQSEERFAVKWRFVESVAASDPIPYVAKRGGDPPHELGFRQRFRIDRGLASVLWTYQRWIYTWGPLLGLLIAVGFIGAIAGRGHPFGTARMAGLTASAASLLLLFSVTITAYHFRYTVPALPLAGVAGASGATALIRVRQKPPESVAGKPSPQHAPPD